MIRNVSALPPLREPSAEGIRLTNLLNCYGGDLPFWSQNDGEAFFTLADGDLTLWGGGDREELREFLDFIRPNSVFARADVLDSLGYLAREPIWVMSRAGDGGDLPAGDELKSDDVYQLLCQGGFSLPSYPAFAVDFCRRKNRGCAGVYGKRGKGVAVWLNAGHYSLLTGLVSFQRGFGSEALSAVIRQGVSRQIVTCCTEPLTAYYAKHGFQKLYQAGSWTKP